MSPPPPPPPPSSGEEIMHPHHASMYTTPPQRQAKSYGYGYSYGYLARRRTANAGSLDAHKSPASSPATSASSAASPSHFHKTKSASELLSPRMRGRMDPYPRYSPRKRLSADYSDGTYSAESATDSPKSEKGGWRIHAAVHGPFLTGPLAKDFVNRVDDLLSPRGKKKEDQDFDNAGLLLFPVIPPYVAPAITPEVFQASIQPQTEPQTEQQPQPEPDHSAAVPPQNDACYYPDTTHNQQPTEASWDASAQQQYYQEDRQQYYQSTAEEQQYYQSTAEQQYYQASSKEQQYYHAAAEQQAAYYYNGGYDQQQYDAGYGYEQSYEQYPAVTSEQPAAEPVATVECPAPPSADEFPPLPLHDATPAVAAEVAESVAVEQSTEPVPAAPQSPVQRPRAPSYAEIVSGAAHSSPRECKVEASQAPKKKPSFDAFSQLSEGIAESMTRILAKSKDSKTSHAEVEFTCVIRRIQTQLKLMGKVTNNLHLEQVKTLHKLQKSEIEKLSMESANMQLQQQIQKLEHEQQELKQQLAVALEAKDQRLKDAVDQLTQRLNGLKSSTDASTAKMASDIDAIRCSGSEDLEKRVQEIGDVLDYLVKHHTGEPSSTALARKNNSSRQSSGSWKSAALYSLVACAASLSGVWVGINYADDIQHLGTSQPLVLEEAAVDVILSQITEDASASYASQIVEIIEETAAAADVADVSNVFVPEAPRAVDVVVAPIEEAVEVAMTQVLEMEVAADLSSATAVVDFIETPTVSANWNAAAADVAVAEPVVEEIKAVEASEVVEAVEAAVEEVAVAEIAVVESIPEVVEAVPAVIETAADVVEVAAEVVIPVEFAVAEVAVVEAAPRAVAADVCKPFALALYAWCPSLFDVPAEEKTSQPVESASPLNGLARALGSLSSRILAENAPVAAEAQHVIADEAPIEVVELPSSEEPTQEVVTVQVETPELPEGIEPVAAVEDVSGSVMESVDAEAAVPDAEVVSEVVETVEVAAVEPVVEYSNATASVSFETSLMEALTYVAVDEAPVVVEAVAEVPVVEAVAEAARSRWAQEQFLVEVGASCGLAADIVAEAVAVESPMAAAVEEPVAEVVNSEWFLLEEPLTLAPHSNTSAPVFVADKVVENEMIETPVVVTESAPEESSLEMCSAPVFDLKTQLLTVL